MQAPDRHPCGVPAAAAAELQASGTTPGSAELVGVWIAVACLTGAAGTYRRRFDVPIGVVGGIAMSSSSGVLALGAVDDLREEAAPGAHGNPALGGVVDLALPAVDGASGLEVLARRRTAGRARVNSTSQSGSGAVMMTSQTSSAAAGILLLQFANQLPGLVSR
jgi:hypothetical protein